MCAVPHVGVVFHGPRLGAGRPPPLDSARVLCWRCLHGSRFGVGRLPLCVVTAVFFFCSSPLGPYVVLGWLRRNVRFWPNGGDCG